MLDSLGSHDRCEEDIDLCLHGIWPCRRTIFDFVASGTKPPCRMRVSPPGGALASSAPLAGTRCAPLVPRGVPSVPRGVGSAEYERLHRPRYEPHHRSVRSVPPDMHAPRTDRDWCVPSATQACGYYLLQTCGEALPCCWPPQLGQARSGVSLFLDDRARGHAACGAPSDCSGPFSPRSPWTRWNCCAPTAAPAAVSYPWSRASLGRR